MCGVRGAARRGVPPSAVLPGGAALRAAAAPLRAAGALRPLRRRAAGAVCCPHCPIASFEHARPACSSQRSGSTSLWKQLTQLAQGQGGRASSVKAYEKPAAVNPTSVTGISRRRKNRKFLPPRPRPASPVQPGNGKRKKNGLCAHAGAAESQQAWWSVQAPGLCVARSSPQAAAGNFVQPG